MAKIFDRVMETTSTEGTGNLTLAGAADGYQAFNDVCSTSDIVPYCIDNGDEWEVGLGTFTAPATLARTKVHASSNSGSAVDLSAGTKKVYLTMSAMMHNRIAARPATGVESPPDMSSDATFAVGSSATAYGASAVAIGVSSQAGTGGIAVGSAANCSGANYGIAIGQQAVASKAHAIALGREAEANVQSGGLALGGFGRNSRHLLQAYRDSGDGEIGGASGDGIVPPAGIGVICGYFFARGYTESDWKIVKITASYSSRDGALSFKSGPDKTTVSEGGSGTGWDVAMSASGAAIVVTSSGGAPNIRAQFDLYSAEMG